MGRKAGVRTWAPLAMAAKVDLSTSTDWKEAKCKCKQEGGARAALRGSSLLCPWDSPGKNTGMGCHFLLYGIFPTGGWNPWLLLSVQSSSRLLCVCVCVCVCVTQS